MGDIIRSSVNKLAKLAKLGLFHIGYYRLRLSFASSRQKRLLILMYHDLAPGTLTNNRGEGSGLITADIFEIHLKAILKDFRPITVEEAMLELDNHGEFRENSVAITFDDGYSSVYNVAWPILRKYGVSATVFITTDWIDGKIRFWWDELKTVVDQGNFVGFDSKEFCSMFQIDPGIFNVNNSWNKGQKESLLNALSYSLMKKPTAIQKDAVDYLKAKTLVDTSQTADSNAPLSWEMIREMAAENMEFGAHTISHLNLSHASDEEAYREMSESKTIIEKAINKEVCGFAYPYGYDAEGYRRFLPMLKEIGYSYACLSWWGSNTAQTNRYLFFRNILTPLRSTSLLRREIYLNFIQKIDSFDSASILGIESPAGNIKLY